MVSMTAQQIVKQLTQELHWTVEEIAVKAGASGDMVRRWLRGENNPTGLRKQRLYKIAEKYLTNGETVRAR